MLCHHERQLYSLLKSHINGMELNYKKVVKMTGKKSLEIADGESEMINHVHQLLHTIDPYLL